MKSTIELYLSVFEYLKDHINGTIIQNDIVNHLMETHKISYHAARSTVLSLKRPFICLDEDFVQPMISMKLELADNGRSCVKLRLHNEWQKIDYTKARNLLANDIIPVLQLGNG